MQGSNPIESTMDLTLSNYSSDDLLGLLQLPPDTSIDQVRQNAAALVARLRANQSTQPALIKFVKGAGERLIAEMLDEEEEDDANQQEDEATQLGQWWQNEAPAQIGPGASQQMAKVTDRKQKIQVFQGANQFHDPMNRERLGINQSYPVPVVQGTMNPIQRNLVTRTIVVDSQYRAFPFTGSTSQPPGPESTASNTDYTLDLSETLNNVLSLRILQVQIPLTWDVFSCSRGNVRFTFHSANTATLKTLSSGSYTPTQLVEAFNGMFASASTPLAYDSNTNRFTLTLQGDEYITFYRPGGMDGAKADEDEGCKRKCFVGGADVQNNLGVTLGLPA